jgi:hypothetical protein
MVPPGSPPLSFQLQQQQPLEQQCQRIELGERVELGEQQLELEFKLGQRQCERQCERKRAGLKRRGACERARPRIPGTVERDFAAASPTERARLGAGRWRSGTRGCG